MKWLTNAADNQHASAAYQLAQLYAKGLQQGDFALAADSKKALHYLKQAADAGLKEAQYDYAQHRKHQPNPTDYIRYLTSAAALDHAQAKLDSREITTEQLARVIVLQNKQLQQQSQQLQVFTQCLMTLAGALEKQLGAAFKLSELLPEGITVLGNPTMDAGPAPASDSDSDEVYQDAVASVDLGSKTDSALH